MLDEDRIEKLMREIQTCIDRLRLVERDFPLKTIGPFEISLVTTREDKSVPRLIKPEVSEFLSNYINSEWEAIREKIVVSLVELLAQKRAELKVLL